MNIINFIHFTDFHFGDDKSERRFKTIQSNLEDDLKLYSDQLGKFDLVLFSGDLTNRGTSDEFIRLNGQLEELWNSFDQNCSRSKPIFLPVPGNHDLLRPKESEAEPIAIQSSYFSSEKFRDNFWDSSEYAHFKKRIIGCFDNFADWWENKVTLPKPDNYTAGILPGDFSAIYRKHDISLGIVGLNSAFLQLAPGPFHGKLDINERQLFNVCDNDPDNWCRQHDFSVIMTHHGSNWLHETARRDFNSDIYKAGRFYCHLYGHMHQPRMVIKSNSSPRKRRFLQGQSLYSLVPVKGEGREERNHGYTIGQFCIEDNEKYCKIWPRAFDQVEGDQHYFVTTPKGVELDSMENSLSLGSELIQVENKKPGEPTITEVLSSSLKEKTRFVEDKRIAILGTADCERIRLIAGHVERLWKRHNGPNWQTLHNHTHNLNVEIALYFLIPQKSYNKIKDQDWFLLIASVWLHEIGMIVGLFEEQDWAAYKKNKTEFVFYVRDMHHTRAVDYIKANSDDLGLNKEALKTLCQICRMHRKNTTLSELKGTTAILSAYLKLALLIHLDMEIENHELFKLMDEPGVSWESKFHWLKIKWIKSVVPDHGSGKIKVAVCTPPEQSTLHDFLPEKVFDDMRENLSMLKGVLFASDISYFDDILEEDGGPLEEEIVSEMELIQSNIELEEISSASEAYKTILITFSKYSKIYQDQGKLFDIYLKNIKKIHSKIRPCHTLIGNLIQELNEILEDETISKENRIKKVNQRLSERQKDRELIYDRIATHSIGLLAPYKSMLLYGYSSMVITAMKNAPDEIKLNAPVYIAECRGKTQFNNMNLMIHNDGINYLKKVLAIGYKNVHFVHDISIGNLMKRDKLSMVLFGANGIDETTGSFGHTCGHSTIADLASIYKIPVYVIADKSKLGNLEWQENLQREIDWMPKNNEISWRPEEYDTSVSFENPREDLVESDRVAMIITEDGLTPPYRIFADLAKKKD